MTGVLYIVATPIGNLEDITLRALRVLREVSVIACEDTRVTRKLLSAHDISTPTISYHAHSDTVALENIVARLARGESIAQVTDAGMPVVSDPGERLVRAAIEGGATVVPIPGASALPTALAASGLPSEAVLFLGFLPRTDLERRERLAPLRHAPYTVVLYESPHRVAALLETLAAVLGTRRACVAREMTKMFETFERGSLAELAARFSQAETLGEITVVVGPPDVSEGSEENDDARVEAEAKKLLAGGVAPGEAAKLLAKTCGIARADAYKIIVKLSGK